jgi:hypothetical protein
MQISSAFAVLSAAEWEEEGGTQATETFSNLGTLHCLNHHVAIRNLLYVSDSRGRMSIATLVVKEISILRCRHSTAGTTVDSAS